MKKILLFAFAMLFATAMMAQNRAVLFEESFDDASIPAGWSVNGLGTTNWRISGTNNAGGEANELHLYWSPQFNGLTRFVSPVIDLTGYSGNVAISFKHCLDNYSGSHPLGIATTSDGGSTWNQAWTQSYSSDGVYNVTKMITTTDVGSSNFQFCITFSGDSYYINNWYFDDIQILALENLDGRMLSVNVPEVSYGQEAGNLAATINFGMTMMNFGMTQITSVEATYEIEGLEPVTQIFNSSIASLANQTFTFTETKTLLPGLYNLTITINKLNGVDDVFVDNNTMQKTFNVSMASEERIPMIEHFTASTCGYCPPVNNQMATLCNNNPGRYTYTKYQMNWPGNGDPYYTEEGGVRRNYYEVSGVPSVFMDGNQTSVNQNNFDQEASKPSCFDVTGSFSVNGNVVHVMVDIAPYVDMEARVYISVNEKETFNNVGTNGETVFHHVMMKMLPDAEGTTIKFVPGHNQHLEFTQNMTGTHVEEMSDLEVSIWVQNYDNKTIYNSRFAYEYSDVHPYPVENLTLVQDPNADCVCLTASWDAPSQGTPIGYNVYVNNELVLANTTTNTYFFEGEAHQFYVVGVEALYLDDKTSIKSIATVLEDLGLITEETLFVLNEENLSAELSVTNANHGSQSGINIQSIEEVNDDDVQYLMISAEELPYLLPYDESYSFTIEANAVTEGKSMARTNVVVTSDAGTVTFSVKVDGDILSVTEVSAKPKLYPNPANNNIRIEGNAIESVKVYNIMGALVESISVNDNNVDVNLSQYSNGVYFFNIRQSDGTTSNQRVVVSH